MEDESGAEFLIEENQLPWLHLNSNLPHFEIQVKVGVADMTSILLTPGKNLLYLPRLKSFMWVDTGRRRFRYVNLLGAGWPTSTLFLYPSFLNPPNFSSSPLHASLPAIYAGGEAAYVSLFLFCFGRAYMRKESQMKARTFNTHWERGKYFCLRKISYKVSVDIRIGR